MEQKKEGDISYRKGKEAYNHHAYEEAAEYLEEAARLSPDKFAYFYLGESLGKLKRHDKALQALAQAYNYLPKERDTKEHVIVLQCQAIQARLLGNFALAQKYNDSALEIGVRMFRGYDLETLKAEVETERADIKKAEMQQATKQIDDMLKAAEEMEKKKAYSDAIEQYTKCIKEKETALGYFRRGKCFYLLQSFKEAVADFDKFMELSKGHSTLEHEWMLYKGMCLAEMEKFEEALKEFKSLFDTIKDDRRNQQLVKEVVERFNATKERMRTRERVKLQAPTKDQRTKEELVNEGKMVQAILKDEKRLDKVGLWHVVSLKWFKLWERYTSPFSDDLQPLSPPTPSTSDSNLPKAFSSEVSEAKLGKPPAPGPIYNDELVLFDPLLKDPDKSKHCSTPLKPGLQEGVDFLLVPDQVWQIWETLYGGLDIPRVSYPATDDSAKPVIDVFLQKVTLVFTEHYVAGLPEGLQTLYISRREPAKELVEKCRRICIEAAGHDKMYQMKVVLWKLTDPDMENVEIVSRKFKHVIKHPIGIDGEQVDETKIIEDLAIGDSTLLLVEVSPETAPTIFVEKKVIKPRIAEFNSADWQKYVTVENCAFMKIPLKKVVIPGYNCGRTGLENMGNTCYMNSGLQCLSNCQELTKYFLLGLNKGEINKENPLGQKGYLANAYSDLILDMWKGGSRVMTAYNLKKRIAIKSEQFSGYAQHDSQELIVYVLDGLHEDLNRIKKKPYIESKDYNGTPDKELSLEQWQNHLKRNRSIIVDLFCGQLKSRLVCPSCHKDSITFDPFMVMSVPIPQLSLLTVTFVCKDITRGAVELKLIVTEGSILADLPYKITEQIKSRENTRLYYAIVHKGKITHRLHQGMNCVEARKLGSIFVYECEDDKRDDTYFLEVGLQYASSGIWGSNKHDLSYPLVLAVPKTATVLSIKQEILAKLMPFMKEVPVGKNQDRVKQTYDYYFGRSNRNYPYIVEIKNNRQKSKKFIFSTQYAECEFCSMGGHAENCKLDFTNEGKRTLGELLKAMKEPVRDLILNVILPEVPYGIDAETLQKHFSNIVKMEPKSVPKINKISLYDCLECFSKEEKLDEKNMWYCPKCKKLVQATKKMDMYRLPDILVIHLKRFKHRTSSIWGSNRKIDDFVDYPISGLDLKRFLKSPIEISGTTTYDLFAVSNHFGGISGGHYTATCYNAALEKWLYFNDSSVSCAGEEDIVSSAGYVLFYRRVDTL